MTAEVGVMNKIGVALAADSAVTMGFDPGKKFTSAEKLFQLSEKAPVGFMVFGNSNFLSVPWETVVKLYRKKLGATTYATLEEYSSDFINYLENNKNLYPEVVQDDFVRNTIIRYLEHVRDDFLDLIERRLSDIPSEKEGLSEEEIEKLFVEFIKKKTDEVKLTKEFDGLADNYKDRFRDKYNEDIREIKKKIFENFPITTGTHRKINALLYELFSRRELLFNGYYSNFVIAGFGEEEHFPSFQEFCVAGVVIDNVLHDIMREDSISEDLSGIVVPFAQREMVYTFMEGIDPDLNVFIHGTVNSLFYKLLSVIIKNVEDADNKISDELKDDLENSIEELIRGLFDSWQKVRKTEYSDPVMKMVSSLPKDELGAMAHSLVNLTRFKRRVSTQPETVSGPIDVAVITKGDGFIWVRRKHYFDQELNPRFIAQYYKEGL